MSDAGPPGAKLTSMNVIALTRKSTITPWPVRWTAMRSVVESFLAAQPPLLDVVHVVAQVQVRDALQVGVDDVDLLGIPEEVVGQIVGHVGLQLGDRLLALVCVRLGLNAGQNLVERGI